MTVEEAAVGLTEQLVFGLEEGAVVLDGAHGLPPDRRSGM